MQEIILKKVLLGGYDCFDVMNHINALQTKINRTKKEFGKLDELNREIEMIEARIAEKDKEIHDLENGVFEYNGETHARPSSEDFIQQTANYADSCIEAARSLEMSVKELTSEQVGEVKVRVDELRENLEKFSDMVGELVVSLSDLKTEYNGINESYAEIVNKSSKLEPTKESKPKKTTTKRTASKSAPPKATKSKKVDDDVLELLNKTEERYKNL